MTEYLVANFTTGPLPAWQRGDVVIAVPDGHGWGRRESLAAWVAEGRAVGDWPGRYYLVRVPEHDWAQTMAFCDANVSWIDASDPDNPTLLAQGRFSLALDDLTSSELAALDTSAEITLSAARMNALLADRANGGARLETLLGP